MGALGLNATIIAQIINFVILFLFLRLVVYPLIVKMLEQRQNYITSNITATEEERRQAEAVHQQYLSDLQKAREEAQGIIQQAAKTGEAQAQEIIEAAKAETIRVKESALSEIAHEREKAVVELRNQVATLSVLMAEKIINQTISPETQQRLIAEFVKEAGDLLC